MAGAFQSNAFQNNAFQVDGAAGSTAGQTILMPGKAGPHGGNFSRKRWNELRATLLAEAEAAALADEKAQKIAVAQSAAAAQKAEIARREKLEAGIVIAAARLEVAKLIDFGIDIEKLTSRLDAAEKAKPGKAIKLAAAVYDESQDLWEEALEEDDMEVLLLITAAM